MSEVRRLVIRESSDSNLFKFGVKFSFDGIYANFSSYLKMSRSSLI